MHNTQCNHPSNPHSRSPNVDIYNNIMKYLYLCTCGKMNKRHNGILEILQTYSTIINGLLPYDQR